MSIPFRVARKRTEKCAGIVCRCLLAASLFPAPAAFPANSLPWEPQQTSEFAALANQICAKLAPDGKLKLVVFDFRKATPIPVANLDSPTSPANIIGLTGESSAFGAWLADQISSALAEAGQPIVGRNVLPAAFQDKYLSPQDTLTYNWATTIAKSVGADAILVGTMSAIQDRIGLTLKVYNFTCAEDPKHPSLIETITGELTITDEIAAHLGAPLNSFGPSDGVYVMDEGGIGLANCVHCPNPPYSGAATAHRIQGAILLSAVVTSEGRATQIKLIKSLGYGLDENAINSVKSWKFKPATDPRGSPVSVVAPIFITFRMF